MSLCLTLFAGLPRLNNLHHEWHHERSCSALPSLPHGLKLLETTCFCYSFTKITNITFIYTKHFLSPINIISCYLYHVISIMKWQKILRNCIPTLLTCKTWSISGLRVRLEASQAGEKLLWMLRAVIALQPGPLLQVVTVDGGGPGYSHGRALLTTFVKMDFGHPSEGGVDDSKDSSVSMGPLSVCRGCRGLCTYFSHTSSGTVHLVSGASRWPGTCIFGWGGWPLSPRNLMPWPLQHWHYKHVSLCPEFMPVLVIEVRALNLQSKHWDVPRNPAMPFLSVSCMI